MIRLFFLSMLFTFALQGAGFWTLTGLEKANVYVQNSVSSLKPDTIKTIKQKMSEMLHKEGIKTEQQDSPTLMVLLEEIEYDESHCVYVKLALGEEVQTYRAQREATFALTYAANDFIDVENDELDDAILESVDFLLSQFVEQYEDDKE